MQKYMHPHIIKLAVVRLEFPQCVQMSIHLIALISQSNLVACKESSIPALKHNRQDKFLIREVVQKRTFIIKYTCNVY